MVRVTAIEVKAIMQNTTIADATVDAFIVAANEVINSVFGTDVVTSYVEIEKWFSAHLLASTIARMTSEEKVGDAMVKYIGKYESGLNSTPYGQMVMLLDTSGLMGKLGKESATMYAIKNFD